MGNVFYLQSNLSFF